MGTLIKSLTEENPPGDDEDKSAMKVGLATITRYTHKNYVNKKNTISNSISRICTMETQKEYMFLLPVHLFKVWLSS